MFVAPATPVDPKSSVGAAPIMANTYTQIYIQIVFAVQDRACLIKPEWKEELFKYISGILRNLGIKLIAIGGVADHIHLLIALEPTIALSDLVRDVKANSSKFINTKGWVKGRFHWQEGFGAFSYSRSQIDQVAKYVLDQERHHQRRSFKEEYIETLIRFEVEHDSRSCLTGSNRCRSYGARGKLSIDGATNISPLRGSRPKILRGLKK